MSALVCLGFQNFGIIGWLLFHERKAIHYAGSCVVLEHELSSLDRLDVIDVYHADT